MGENPFLHQEKVHNFKSTKNAVFVGPKKALIFGLKLYFFFTFQAIVEEGNEKGINVPMKMRPHCSRNYSTICCCEDEAITKVLFLLIDSQSY